MYRVGGLVAPAIVLALLAAPAAAQDPVPALTEEQQADQRAAVAGEARPTDEQPQPTSEDALNAPQPASPRAAALEHIGRIETIVKQALGAADVAEPAPVGTAGTRMTAATGETVTISRARLEEIRLHLEQIRAAMQARPFADQQP